MASTTDIAIVGAGVVGCSVAWELSRAGVRCLLIDSQEVGREASWATLGVATHPGPGRSPFAVLRREGHRYFGEFVRQLETETDIDFEYHRTGAIEPIFTEEQDKEARRWEQSFQNYGLPKQRLTPSEALEIEPNVSAEILAAYYQENDHQVRNPRFVRAIAEAAGRLGAELRLNDPVRSILSEGSRVIGVETESGPVHCGKVILAAGAWSNELAKTVGLDLPVEPRKGQVALLEGPAGMLKHMIHGEEVFCVPRMDGKILLGATVENVGFDKRVTAGGIHSILTAGVRVFPKLAELPILRTWAGIRPYAARRGGPFLGPMAANEDLIIAAGHYRSGILLAPITARLMKELLVDGQPSLSLDPFRPDR